MQHVTSPTLSICQTITNLCQASARFTISLLLLEVRVVIFNQVHTLSNKLRYWLLLKPAFLSVTCRNFPSYINYRAHRVWDTVLGSLTYPVVSILKGQHSFISFSEAKCTDSVISKCQGSQSKRHSLGCFARAAFLKGQIAGVKKKAPNTQTYPCEGLHKLTLAELHLPAWGLPSKRLGDVLIPN